MTEDRGARGGQRALTAVRQQMRKTDTARVSDARTYLKIAFHLEGCVVIWRDLTTLVANNK